MKKGYAKYLLFLGLLCVFAVVFTIGMSFLLIRANAGAPVSGLTRYFLFIVTLFAAISALFFGILCTIAVLYRKKHR